MIKDDLILRGKPFDIPRQFVWNAYKEVRKNRGAAGADGQTIAMFDKNRDYNLYKIWNRLSSGSYFPPAVLKKEIPKANGKVRTLGIPSVSDRIAQGAVKQYLEQKLDKQFHPDSYGYRPNKSAHDALEVTRKRVWKYGWLVELDIEAFFDNVSHELIQKALAFHKVPDWVMLYCMRWMKADMVDGQGNLTERNKGTPQGGVISPLLANLFLHHGMDQWLQKHFPNIPFARYADDGVLHCCSKHEAKLVIMALTKRLTDIGLTLHPTKTKMIYIGRGKPKDELLEFTFLGYDFKRRVLKDKQGRLFFRVCPGASKSAMKTMTKTIKGWKIHRSSGMSLRRLAQTYNATLRGWINYYGKYWYRHFGYRLWSVFQSRLIKWMQCRYRLSHRKAESRLNKIRQSNPFLFVHWHMLNKQGVYSRAV